MLVGLFFSIHSNSFHPFSIFHSPPVSTSTKFMPKSPVRNCAGRMQTVVKVKMYSISFIRRSWKLSKSTFVLPTYSHIFSNSVTTITTLSSKSSKYTLSSSPILSSSIKCLKIRLTGLTLSKTQATSLFSRDSFKRNDFWYFFVLPSKLLFKLMLSNSIFSL